MPHSTNHAPNRRAEPEGVESASTRSGHGDSGAAPPLLTGGAIQQNRVIPTEFDPIASGTDYITVTVSKAAGTALTLSTHPFEPGTPQRGFKSSERRLCPGGAVWRRWSPGQPSNHFGDDYESWETEAEASRWLDLASLPLDSRPSRQDYAFDFAVLPDLMPRDLLPLFRDHLAGTRIEPHFAGPESSCTVYIGSRQSDRRVKIYRRDLKDPALLADGFPPMIRIELELRGDYGHALWQHRQATGADGLAVACTHIAAMIGYRVAEESQQLPSLIEASDEADASQMLFQFIHQNAGMLDAADRAGIDLAKLARARVHLFSRATEYRHAQRVGQLLAVDPRSLERSILAMIRGGSRSSGLGE